MAWPTLGLYGLLAALAVIEWSLWRSRRQRIADINRFMEWDAAAPAKPPAPPRRWPRPAHQRRPVRSDIPR